MDTSSTAKTNSRNLKKRERKREANMKEKIAAAKQIPINKEQDPVEVIKAQLAEAKANGDAKLAGKLRQDLWILKDVNSGVDPALEDKVAIGESLERLANHVPTNVLIKNDIFKEEPLPVSTLLPTEKELKKLNKKLKDIESLKLKQANGVVLEQTQINKVEREEGIREEIRQLEVMMTGIRTS